MGYEWLALISAALWALTSLISVTPARHLGAFSYSRWRMTIVTAILVVLSLFTHGLNTIHGMDFMWLISSGIIGIFIGDTALFACMNRVGPRRAELLFTCNAIFSPILGILFFNETLSLAQLGGATLLLIGVALAIMFGKNQSNHWEAIRGPLAVAILLGLVSALGQSFGSILAKPAMHANTDAIAASMIRMASAFVSHMILWWRAPKLTRALKPMNWSIFRYVFANGFLAMAVGMTLILYALRHGDVGLVALFSATTPIMILPMLWIYTKQAPTRSAWVASALVVLGTGLLL
ncbi:DMT family transporter [Celerinatantimonas sp. MCCC 1A17872]|uniref:DMT family transporter n=1 Tax=Celerinatantimonas sp. MCCC 1A17872 TaxID=3177514 RepID=UPI0038BE3F7D